MNGESQIEEMWSGYENLYNKVKDDDFEKIKGIIQCFSSYMSHSDSSHHYNGTYLPKFTDEFWKFLRYFNKKYFLVRLLFAVTEGKQNITLKIDRYWQIETETDWRGKRITCLGDTKSVCNDKMLIECSVLYNTKRHVYHERIDIKDMVKEKYSDLIKPFQQFLETYFPSETKENIDEKLDREV